MLIDTTDAKGKPEVLDQEAEESFEILEHSGVEGQSKTNDEAFVNLDQRDLELEILSNIDPNDEFLQSEKSFSLIDGVSQNEQDFSILSGQSSEFSIISGS